MRKLIKRIITWGPVIYPIAKKIWKHRKQSNRPKSV
ncbi:MAG TPA: hypothetical protein VNR61_11275 [Niallia sp.]|nr:hypothetical protein [Niallia sp.]